MSMRRESGFTLIELLISVFIVSLVAGVISHFIFTQNRTANSIRGNAELEQDVRAVLNLMVSDIRAVGYNIKTKKFDAAEPTRIKFQGDVDNNGVPNTIEYSIVDGKIHRAVWAWVGDVEEVLVPDSAITGSIQSFSITYFDLQGNPITDPAQVDNIRSLRIVISGSSDARADIKKLVRDKTLSVTLRPRNL